MSYAVIGLYARPSDAAQALRGLEARGFVDDDVSLLAPDEQRIEHALAHRWSGVAAGALGMGILGAVVGGLTTAGAITGSGGGVLMAGPLVALVAGAHADGLIGALVGCGLAEHEAELFADEVDHGKVLVAVRCFDRDAMDTAERVLVNAGAETTSRA